MKTATPAMQSTVSVSETAAGKVIPFRFESREVRTLLIDGQPWFVASDVASALLYRDSFNMHRNLDDDEKGTQIVSTLGGKQEMLLINESGLYSAILRSRKDEAKRFKKWVTAEVLPAIRKHGRYGDTSNKLGTLVGQTIGTDGFRCLAGVLDGKVRHLPMPLRRRAKGHIWSQVHKAFSVVSAEDIPADQMDSARNFLASYTLDGQWLPAEDFAPGETLEATIARLTEQVKKPNSYPVELFMPLVDAVMAKRGSYHYPIETARPPKTFSKRQAWLTVENMMHSEYQRPIQGLLNELKRDGFDVAGCRAEYEGLYVLAHRLHVVSKEMARVSEMSLRCGKNTRFPV